MRKPDQNELILPPKCWASLEPMGTLYTAANPIVRWIFLLRLKMVLDSIQTKQGVVLDLGTGNGILIPSLTEIMSQVIGIDSDNPEDEGDLAVVKKMANVSGYRGKPVELIRGDAHHLPLKERVLDYVLCVSILDHLPDLKLALDDIKRVLKSDGKLIVGIMPDNFLIRLLRSFFAKIMSLLMRWSGNPFATHVNSFDKILDSIDERYHIINIKKPFSFLAWQLSYYIVLICQPMH